MKKRLFAALAASALLIVAPALYAQQFPSKPVRIVAPYPPGGPSDSVIRAVAERMRVTLGQPVLIENKPGAGTAIGSDYVAASPPDGYTLLFAGSAMTMLPAVAKVNYDPVKNFAPISGILELAEVLVVRSDLPVTSVKELVDYMKKNPGKVNFANAGTGTVTYFQAEELRAFSGTDFTNVPYKGAAPALQDLLGGRIQATYDGMSSIGPHISSGAVRALAVAMPRRSSALPNVPTMAEIGYPQQEAVAWAGLLAPAGTPKEVIERLHLAVVDAVNDPGVQTRLRGMGGEPASSTPEALGERVRRETEKWPRMARTLGIKPE